MNLTKGDTMKTRIFSAVVAVAMVAAPAAPAQAKKAPRCDGKKATIVSSAALIKGTDKRDVIYVKGAKRHTVLAGAGNDLVCGSAGADTIDGGPGNDKILGKDGADALFGGAGSDKLFGGAGSDELDGNDGIDVLNGGAGTDVKHLGFGDTDGDVSDRDVNDDDSVLSELSAQDQALAALLGAAADYLDAGIQAGDITGVGAQATLPDAPGAGSAKPVDSRIKHVTWSVTGSATLGCVDGTADGVTTFKVRLDPRDGMEAAAFEAGAEPAHTFTTGRCGANPLGTNVPSGASSDLQAARDKVVAGLMNGAVTGEGDTDFAVYVGSTGPADDYLVSTVLSDYVVRVQWVTSAISGGSSTHVCIDTVVDPMADELDFYSYDGTITVTTVAGVKTTVTAGSVVHDSCAPLV